MNRNSKGYSAPPGSTESILGSLFGVAFTLYWTAGVIKAKAPVIMVAVGVFCIAVTTRGFVDSIIRYRKRKQNEDFYGSSAYPYEEIYGEPDTKDNVAGQGTVFSGKLEDVYRYTDRDGNIYCPYCGIKIAHDFEYCPKCGRKLPF